MRVREEVRGPNSDDWAESLLLLLFKIFSGSKTDIFTIFLRHEPSRHRVVVPARQPMYLGYSIPDSVPGIDSSPHSRT